MVPTLSPLCPIQFWGESSVGSKAARGLLRGDARPLHSWESHGCVKFANFRDAQSSTNIVRRIEAPPPLQCQGWLVDPVRCERGLEALRGYRREYDAKALIIAARMGDFLRWLSGGRNALGTPWVRRGRWIPENADPLHFWQTLRHHLQSLSGKLREEHRHSGNVSTRLGETCDVPETDGIGMDGEYNRNRGGRLACDLNKWNCRRCMGVSS
jgi:hypothetical protein